MQNTFETGQYHGGPIVASDYDTGFYDTPAIELELEIEEALAGTVDSKGIEDQARRAFKSRIAQDLSEASPLVSISAVDLPVVDVSPRPMAAKGVLVVVHVLQLQGERGPDECWQIASNLVTQSSDRNSPLLHGTITCHVPVGCVRLFKTRSRQGMSLQSFTEHENSRLAGLEKHHVFALRAYTSDSFRFFNGPMRSRLKPHPLMFTIYFLDQALKKLTTVEAKLRPAEYNKIKYLWRGMRNMKLDADTFFAEGGTELAPMSTTGDRDVALHYSESDTPLIFRFEARGRTRGVDIGYVSLCAPLPAPRAVTLPPRVVARPSLGLQLTHCLHLRVDMPGIPRKRSICMLRSRALCSSSCRCLLYLFPPAPFFATPVISLGLPCIRTPSLLALCLSSCGGTVYWFFF